MEFVTRDESFSGVILEEGNVGKILAFEMVKVEENRRQNERKMNRVAIVEFSFFALFSGFYNS